MDEGESRKWRVRVCCERERKPPKDRVNHIKRMRKEVMSSGRGNAGGKEKESAEVEEQRRHRGGGWIERMKTSAGSGLQFFFFK